MSQDRYTNFIFLIVLLFFIQVIFIIDLQFFENRYYKTLSEGNSYRKVIVPAVRGNIISSDSVVIATSKKYFSLFCNLDKFDITADNILNISKIIEVDPDSINQMIGDAKRNNEKEICLKNNLNIDDVTFIEENRNHFPEFDIRYQPKRYYPYEYLYSHIVGYVGKITGNELYELKMKGYSISDFVGKTGVEKSYESFLKGRNGIKYYEVDVTGDIVREVEQKNSLKKINGDDIFLSINHKLQSYIDTIFKDFQSGTAIVLDCQSGGILSLYSKPSFDPNIFITGIRNDVWEYLRTNIFSPFLNRATNGLYPPGSVFKIVTFLTALQDEKADSNTFFQPCYGSIMISNRIFKCWKVHNELNLFDALINSCDIYFYQLGMKVGVDAIYRGATELGFGDLTGVDIFEESRGIIPDSKFLNKKYGKNMWGMGQIANLSIGQGDILVTPIQVASMFLIIANDGKVIRPHVVDSVKTKNGEKIFEYTKKIQREVKFEKKYLKLLKNSLYNVVNSDNGTALLARIDKNLGYISGKTGTAENSSGEPHAWFGSIYTDNDGNNRLVIVVVIENGGHGGDDPAKITKMIVEKYLRIKNGF
uniref:Penicillin-binding protein 2 n=1 Tax=candidate division WOR-3 bacterium TaxID=2052148 RepID=A0A7C3N6E1_UNCW3